MLSGSFCTDHAGPHFGYFGLCFAPPPDFGGFKFGSSKTCLADRCVKPHFGPIRAHVQPHLSFCNGIPGLRGGLP